MSHNVESDEAFCERLLGGEDRVDARSAYERFLAQRTRAGFARTPALLAALAAAAIVAIVVFAAPLRTLAGNFIAIFQPKQFVAVNVASLNGRLLPDLQAFGTMRGARHGTMRAIASPHDGDAIVGFHVLVPGTLPGDIPLPSHAAVVPLTQTEFTFSAAKARAWQAHHGRSLPAMPPRLDGTRVEASFGPAVYQVWGVDPLALRKKHARVRVDTDDVALAIVQARAPVVRSSGASLASLEAYLLAMPGISPELAAQIRAIGDANTTLPVPFRSDKQTAKQVSIDGASGVAVGDNTGVGAGVLWQKDGVIYFVGGHLSEDAVIGIANGLH